VGQFVDHILWTFVDKEARTCGHWHYYYTAIGDFLVIFNSSVNFVIYILTSRNFRHGLMLMQTASATSGRDAAALVAGRGRREGPRAGAAAPARSEYIGLERRCLANGGNGELAGTAAGAVPRLTTAPLTPVVETSSPLVRHSASALPTRYFEPRIILD